MNNKKVTVFLIEEISLMRVKIIEYITRNKNFQIVGAVDNIAIGYESILKLYPQIVIINLKAYDSDDYILIQKIKERIPEVEIVVSVYNKTDIQDKEACIDFFINKIYFYKELFRILQR